MGMARHVMVEPLRGMVFARTGPSAPARSEIRQYFASTAAGQGEQDAVQVDGLAQEPDAAVAYPHIATAGVVAAHADVVVVPAAVVPNRPHGVGDVLRAGIVAGPVAPARPGSQGAGGKLQASPGDLEEHKGVARTVRDVGEGHGRRRRGDGSGPGGGRVEWEKPVGGVTALAIVGVVD